MKKEIHISNIINKNDSVGTKMAKTICAAEDWTFNKVIYNIVSSTVEVEYTAKDNDNNDLELTVEYTIDEVERGEQNNWKHIHKDTIKVVQEYLKEYSEIS